MRALVPALLVSSALSLAACGSNDEFASAVATSPPANVTPATDAAATSTTPVATETPAATTTKAATKSSGSSVKVTQGKCATVPAPAAKSPDVPKPQGSLSASKKNVVTMHTSCGTIQILLNVKEDPKTSNAFAWLVKHKYYDKVPFTRVAQGFVIQGGDPTGTGSGGPSWKVVEPPPTTETYPVGTVAMAKTTVDPVGTVGSQFFVMTGGSLPAEYAVAGKVTFGMDAVKAIEAEASAADGPPKQPIVILDATFKAS